MSNDEIKRITASEIVASLKIEVDADLVTQLDAQLAKADSAQSQSKKKAKFVFLGNGSYITVSGIYEFSVGEVSFPVGRATSLKKGSGVLWTTYVAHGLSGGYRLEFGAGTARVYEEGEQIWIWKGEVGGLEGTVDVVFGAGALATFANIIFPAV